MCLGKGRNNKLYKHCVTKWKTQYLKPFKIDIKKKRRKEGKKNKRKKEQKEKEKEGDLNW